MENFVSLQYPNGRIHEATYSTSEKLKLEAEFDLHGRRWRVVGPTKTHRGYGDAPRLLCVSTGTTSQLTSAASKR